MHRIFRFAALAGLFALAACDRSATGSDGALTGTWRYRAVGLVQPGSGPAGTAWACDEEFVVDIAQDGSSLTGLTRPASHRQTCRTPAGELREVVGSTNPYAVDGEIEDGRLHLHGPHHNFGEVHPSRIEGYVEGYSSTMDNPNVTLSEKVGTFVMERIQ